MCQFGELTVFTRLSSIHATMQCDPALIVTGAGKETGRLGPVLSCNDLHKSKQA